MKSKNQKMKGGIQLKPLVNAHNLVNWDDEI